MTLAHMLVTRSALAMVAAIWTALGALAGALPAVAEEPDACATIDEFGLEGFEIGRELAARCRAGTRRTRGVPEDKSEGEDAALEDSDAAVEDSYRRPQRRPRAIYVEDERLEAEELTGVAHPRKDALLRAVSATAILTRKQKMTPTQGGHVISIEKYMIYEKDVFNARVPLCRGERFADQEVGGFCTAFLVAPDVVATAGHCVNYEDVEDAASPKAFRVVFGFETRDGQPRDLMPSERIFDVIHVRGLEKTNALRSNPDFALLQLDRPVPADIAQPLRLPRRAGERLELGKRLALIGHPSGLPKKISLNPASKVMDLGNGIEFHAQLNAFKGNSGSPVVFYDNPDVLAGILVSGQADFSADVLDGKKCVRHQVYSADQLCGRKRCSETVTMVEQIEPYLMTPGH